MFYPESKSDATQTKSIAPDLETKSFIGQGISFPDFLSQRGMGDLSAFAAICLYEEAMPLFNAVDIRATAFSQIPIRLYDKAKKEYVDNHPVLELLSKPNMDISQIEFLYSLSSFYDITGENFTVATGRTSGPPLELISVSPAFTTFGEHNNLFGLLNIPTHIRVQSTNSGERIYKSIEDKGRLRFINATEDQELYHMKTFNPLKSAGNYRGLSKAKSLWLELQQYISGNKTNLSMLKRGTRLSMAWVNTGKEELSAVQWERMQQEAQKYAGENNAGGTPVLDGMDVKTIQQTNRDMEFGKLQDAMLSRVSNTYDVPLALLLDGSMTMDNLKTSVFQLYDMGVLPHAKRMYDELGRFLLPRYPNTENFEFRYNESEIPAMRARLIETAKTQKEIGVNSTNEIREMIGSEAVVNAGDSVLVSTTMIPIEIVENPPEPITPETTNTPNNPGDDKGLTFDKFATILRKCVDDKGLREYSEAEIVALSLERGLLDGD